MTEGGSVYSVVGVCGSWIWNPRDLTAELRGRGGRILREGTTVPRQSHLATRAVFLNLFLVSPSKTYI